MVDSLKDGYAKSYYENGLVYYEGEYQKGKRIGWHSLYYKGGKLRQKYLYDVNPIGERAILQQYFNEEGVQTSQIRFAQKRLEITRVNDGQLSVGDTLNLRIRILAPKYKNVEAMIGAFDENLNITQEIEDPAFLVGQNHQVLVRMVMTVDGECEITGLIRDYEEIKKSDSTTFILGEDSFFRFKTFVVKGNIKQGV